MKNFFRIAALFLAFGLVTAFAGCSNASGGGGAPAPAPSLPTYTVAFNSNGGSEVTSQTVTSGQTATKPSDPSKDHFNFVEWCSDQACQTAFDFATPITDDITLYAKWSSLPVYVVTFVLNGGKYGSSDTYTQNVETGSKVSRPASDPIKDDNVGEGVTTKYAFVNWYADAGCNTLFDFDATTISGPATVYAKWNETNYYTVTFELNGGKYGASDTYTQSVLKGSKVTRPASNPTKDDNVSGDVTIKYTFDNWYADSGCGTLFDFDATTISGPTTVYAKWNEIKCYAVKIANDIEHGSVSSNITVPVVAGTLVTLSATPNPGYELDSYSVTYSNSNIEPDENGKFMMPASPVIVTATFRPVSLTLEAIEAGAKVSFDNKAVGPVTYRVNGGEKQTIESNTIEIITLVNVGDKVSFYGDNTAYGDYYEDKCSKIFCDKDCYVYGNIMSLIDSTNYENANILKGNFTFKNLFKGNSHIKNNPKIDLVLPATMLMTDCYISMFSGCTSLTNAPALSATTLAEGCYWGMFRGCTSLSSAPELPASTLAEGCYREMFKGCTSLTSAPELPATTLAKECYRVMFSGCTSLSSAPELPASTLAEGCYREMFKGCTSLTSAPELPAKTLVKDSYSSMFYGCSNLSSITCSATNIVDIIKNNCTTSWLYGVNSTGTFNSPIYWPSGSSGIPVGWTSSLTPEKTPLTLEAIVAGAIVTFDNKASGPVYYLTNGKMQTIAKDETKEINLSNVGDSVSFFGDNTAYATGINNFSNISCDKDCYIYGNIMSLVDSSNYVNNKTLSKSNTFCCLFENNSHIKNKLDKELILPATTLSVGCYQSLFHGCTSLTRAPELPATKLKNAGYCYGYMFEGCTGLTNAPELPATTLAMYCYKGMFNSCSSLTSAPTLPATGLEESCYEGMFACCASLTSAPALPAKYLQESCYERMFYGCTSLTSVPELNINSEAYRSCYEMFSGCTSLTSVPFISSEGSAEKSHAYMFLGCTNLKSVTYLSYAIAEPPHENWLLGVNSTGTFIKSPNMTSWPSGASGIPEGWTVVDYQE